LGAVGDRLLVGLLARARYLENPCPKAS